MNPLLSGIDPSHPAACSAALSASAVVQVADRLLRSKLFRDYREAFESTTGLPLVFRRAGSFRTPLQGSKRANAFCIRMTQDNATCGACLQLQQRLENEAPRSPQTLRCYAGLNESVVPVRLGDQVLGYLQTGQVLFRPPSAEDVKTMIRATGAHGNAAERSSLVAAYLQTRVITRKQYHSIVQLLTIFAEHLATVSNQLFLSADSTEPPVISRARAFIAVRRSDPLSLGEVARAVHMSSCGLCRIFKKTTGLTFTDYLARERIELVKRALLNLHTRVSEAAFAAGFQSLSQFNRVFQRVAGETPTVYRHRIHAGGKPLRLTVLVHAA